jgi:hypothetical protein
MALWLRALRLWAIASAIIGWFYQLSGSETIAFSAQKLATSKETLGWNRTREYPVANSRELEWREQSGEGDNAGLQCKLGWRTIKFAHHISEDEAQEILTARPANELARCGAADMSNAGQQQETLHDTEFELGCGNRCVPDDQAIEALIDPLSPKTSRCGRRPTMQRKG